MHNTNFDLPLDARTLGFVDPETLANDPNAPVLELLRHALDVDGAMSQDPALGLLLGLRREVFILAAAIDRVTEDDLRMALHGVWQKLTATMNLHQRQIETLRAALAAQPAAPPALAPVAHGKRRRAAKDTAIVVRRKAA